MIVRQTQAAGPAQGFTLIEMMIAMALFALISLAGVGLIETVVGIEDRTGGRAERLAEIQRGMLLITADFEQLSHGPDRDGDAVSLARSGAGGTMQVSYVLRGGAVHRIVNGTDRALIGEVAAVRWQFLKDGNWIDQPTSKERPDRPRAVELVIDLAAGPKRVGGPLRRVLELPGEAP